MVAGSSPAVGVFYYHQPSTPLPPHYIRNTPFSLFLEVSTWLYINYLQLSQLRFNNIYNHESAPLQETSRLLHALPIAPQTILKETPTRLHQQIGPLDQNTSTPPLQIASIHRTRLPPETQSSSPDSPWSSSLLDRANHIGKSTSIRPIQQQSRDKEDSDKKIIRWYG